MSHCTYRKDRNLKFGIYYEKPKCCGCCAYCWGWAPFSLASFSLEWLQLAIGYHHWLLSSHFTSFCDMLGKKMSIFRLVLPSLLLGIITCREGVFLAWSLFCRRLPVLYSAGLIWVIQANYISKSSHQRFKVVSPIRFNSNKSDMMTFNFWLDVSHVCPHPSFSLGSEPRINIMILTFKKSSST